jgi:replicative DNA helicase
MRSDDARLEILSSGLESQHFHFRPYKLAFTEILDRFYADQLVDPLSIAEAIGPKVAAAWDISEREAVDRLVALAIPDPADTVTAREHARIIRRHHAYRELTGVASAALQAAVEQDRSPDEIAGALSAAATRIVTGSMVNNQILSYPDIGRRWLKAEREEIAARAAGMDLGAFFGIPGIDDYVKGLRPTELMFLGGDPGSSKTAIAMAMIRNFAMRQMKKAPEHRVGVLFLSLEMGEKGVADRFAQMESKVQGEMLRMGLVTPADLTKIAGKWAQNRDLPITANFSGELRESQIKALCIDGIRRHQVGLVVVDHFRFINTDERFSSRVDADDQVVKFLKASLAKDLNLAVVCIAHTTKGDGSRPRMDDLRGSKMISALADIVAFSYQPWKHLSDSDRDTGAIDRTEFELIFDKVRASSPGTGEVYVDMSTMTVS